MTKLLRSCHLLIEGAHRVGKNETIGLFNTAVQYRHTIRDRGFASVHAFNKVFSRPPVDTEQAIHDFFACPSALVVYFKLGHDDYENERLADIARKASWSGLSTDYENRFLDEAIAEAIDMAAQLGYSDRVLVLEARSSSAAAMTDQLLNFVSNLLISLEANQ